MSAVNLRDYIFYYTISMLFWDEPTIPVLLSHFSTVLLVKSLDYRLYFRCEYYYRALSLMLRVWQYYHLAGGYNGKRSIKPVATRASATKCSSSLTSSR